MRVLSLFSGVGGMDLGLERAGHEIVGMCEIDPKARSVLARHWPGLPMHDDVTTFDTEVWRGRVDVVAGGSPCQDLSVAGKRAGLDGDRSRLFWHQCRIADSVAADWVLWENVAGALTSNDGADFAAVLWGITGALPDVPDGGWRSAGVCIGPKRTAIWRLLDAQWFGVAQRRRRAFIVAGPGGECGPEVLLEPESVSGASPPSRSQGQEVAGTLGGGTLSSGPRTDTDRMTFVVEPSAYIPDVVGTLGPTFGSKNYSNVQEASQGAIISTPFVKVIRSGARDADGNLPPEVWREEQVAPTLTQCDVGETRTAVAVASHGAVRRLTPRECERLMGWPDDWTRYDADGAEIADSPRYRMCGNGVVASVAEWIGRRLP